MSPKLAAALASIIWGFTYIISTKMLPHNPMFMAAVRALGGGLPLLLISRDFIPRPWWGRLILLGTLNSGLFFALFFISVLRLPGGVAATFQALGPLFYVLLAWPMMGVRPGLQKILAVVLGAIGVGLVVLKGGATIDVIGVLAALSSALCLAVGGTLVQKWGRPNSLVGFTAWQLIVAGVELSIVTAVIGDVPDHLTAINVIGFVIMALMITSLTFVLWFRAIQAGGATRVAPFILLTPVTAFILDAAFKAVWPGTLQLIGVSLVIASLLYSQQVDRRNYLVARQRAHSGPLP